MKNVIKSLLVSLFQEKSEEDVLIVKKISCNKKCEKCHEIEPSYGYPGKTATHCSNCKLTKMILLYKKICEDCGKIACYGLIDKNPTHCIKHASSKMKDVVHKRCVSCDLFRSQKKYDYYCFDCYCFKFPDKVVPRRRLTKQKALDKLIQEAYPRLNIQCDKTIKGGCSKRRPDWFIDQLTHVIIIECDENQHSQYEKICENRRTMEIFEDIGRRPLVMLRFNPDKYKVKGKTIKGCFMKDKPTYQLNVRFTLLKDRIDYWRDNVPDKEITNELLFIDQI